MTVIERGRDREGKEKQLEDEEMDAESHRAGERRGRILPSRQFMRIR